MKNGFDRISGLVAVCGLAAAVAVTALLQTGRAQDAIPAPPPSGTREATTCDHSAGGQARSADDHLHRVVVNDKGQLTIFIAKLPAVGQILKDACPAQTCCEEIFQRLAAECNVDVCERQCGARFVRFGCPVQSDNACAGGVCAEHVELCTAHPADCKCSVCSEVAAEAKCGNEHCQAAAKKPATHAEEILEHHPLKLLGHIANLVGEKAAAQAALEAKCEAHEELAELYETLAELMTANAALHAKLEAQAEQAKLAEKLADLAVENARLKTHVELAAERAEVTRNALSLTLENERLKFRLAEIEQKQAIAEAARTAQRAKAERKAR